MNNQEATRLIRNLPTMCEFTDAYGEPIDSDAYYEAVDMAISALQAQEAKAQLSAEGTTNLQPTCNNLEADTISRQAAIDVCNYAIDLWHGQLGEGIVIAVKKKIEELPSAQPEIEERTEESAQNVPKEDLISRKAAIDAIADCTVYGNADELEEAVMQGNDWNRWSGGVLEALEAVKELPSAQPEPQWIPVSERLPKSKPEDLEYPTVIACCEDGEVMTACYYESTKEWGTGENYDKKINPVAWMPLPEPYSAERRIDE